MHTPTDVDRTDLTKGETVRIEYDSRYTDDDAAPTAKTGTVTRIHEAFEWESKPSVEIETDDGERFDVYHDDRVLSRAKTVAGYKTKERRTIGDDATISRV